jgi:hypothetical protein
VVEEAARAVEMMALVMDTITLFPLIESRPLRHIAKVRT